MSIFDDVGDVFKGKGKGNPIGAVEHAVEGAVRDVKHAGQSAVNDVRHEGEKALHSIKGALPELEHIAQKVAQETFQHAVVPVLSEVLKPIERIVFTVGVTMLEAVHEVAKAAVKEIGNEKAFIEDFNKINFYVANTGNVAIGMYFHNLWDRAPEVIAELKKSEKGIPLKRSAIMEFIERVGPHQVDITASGKIEIGIEIGGSVGAWGVPASLFEYLLDDVLKKAGLPE